MSQQCPGAEEEPGEPFTPAFLLHHTGKALKHKIRHLLWPRELGPTEQDLAPLSRDGCRQAHEAGGVCFGPDGTIKAQGKKLRLLRALHLFLSLLQAPSRGQSISGSWDLSPPSFRPISSPAQQPHTLQRPGRDLGCSQGWNEGGCSQSQHTKGDGEIPGAGHCGNTPWSSPAQAEAPRQVPSFSRLHDAPGCALCRGLGKHPYLFLSILPSLHPSISLSLHPSCHPSISYTAHPPAQPSGCLHFACSVPLALCRSRSCQHPMPQAPHPWENGAGSPVVISIRTPFQHLSTQPMTCWLSLTPFPPGICRPLAPSAL